jgi:hypothetical protein
MHETHQHLVAFCFLNDVQVGPVTVDGIILHPGETTGINQDIPLAIGEMKNVRPGVPSK